MFVTLLIIRPAATNSPQESAISKTTSALLILPMRKLDAPRVSSLRISLMSARDDWIAGIAPEINVVKNATRIVNISTCGCSLMSMKNGICVTVIARLNIAIPKYATMIPKTVATSDSTSDSARNCRTTAERDAPSAVRMPTSFVR
jgi:hypothetical protein